MLKQLRRKFTLITLALATLVLLVVLVFNTVTSYQAEKREIYRSLDRVSEIARQNAAEPPAEFPPQEGEGEFSEEPPPAMEPGGEGGREGGRDLPRMGRDELPGIYAFAVLCDADGNVVSTFAMNADMTEEDLTEAVKTALAAKGDDGSLGSPDLIYRRYARPDGSVQIAFSSYASLSRSLRQNILISLIVFAVGTGLLFLVSLFLSGLALRPVAEAWEGQKRFVADVSHDLRTPLTVILANNNILRTHPDETVAHQMKWIDATDEEAERMRSLTEKMLELSKSETVGDAVELTPVDLSDLVGEVVMNFEPVAFDAGVSLDAKIDPGIVARSDRDAFLRVAHILIDNAVKYAERGSAVEVTLTRKKQIVFSVKNRGEVIPEGDIPHLFDRFWRADRVRSVGGHGLGLSIAKNLTAAIKGKISAVSTAEEGTVFTVALPDKA